MKIGELFLDLGVKGSDSAGKALQETKAGMDGLFSSSLAVKAAIAGVMFGMQRMMSSSASMGSGLSNFGALTGISTQKLQQWQYAARQVGVTNEDVTGSFKGLQNAFANQSLGKGTIEGFAMVSQKVGLDKNRLKDTEYVLGQLQKYAQAVPEDVGNLQLKSFGISEGMIAAMRKGAFNAKAFKQANIYSDGEIGQLSKVEAAWGNIATKIEMAFGHFTAKNGMKLVKDLSTMTDSAIHLAEALERISTSFGLITKIGQTFEGIANTLKLVEELMTTMNSDGEPDAKNKMIKKTDGEWLPGFSNSPMGQFFGMDKVTPEMKAAPVHNSNHKTTVAVTNVFKGKDKDHHVIGDTVKKAVRDAVHTSQTQKQKN